MANGKIRKSARQKIRLVKQSVSFSPILEGFFENRRKSTKSSNISPILKPIICQQLLKPILQYIPTVQPILKQPADFAAESDRSL